LGLDGAGKTTILYKLQCVLSFFFFLELGLLSRGKGVAELG
jgi:hypothetical protein